MKAGDQLFRNPMPEQPDSIAQHYHQRTKYNPKTIHDKSKPLDWTQQPIPFKEYKIGALFDLKPFFNTAPSKFANDLEGQWWQRLSTLLWCTYGITNVDRGMGDALYLRSAPSAGGLYPAEVYLISRGTPLLPAGLFNYQPRTHSLIHFWENDVWNKLQVSCFWHPVLENTQLAVIVTAVFFRSAWRYQDRGYRRIHLDIGHILGNLELAAAMTDFRPHLIGSFMDEAVNQLLYLEPSQEGAIAVLPIADRLQIRQNLPLAKTVIPAHRKTDYGSIPDGQLLTAFHQATQIDYSPNAKVNWKLSATDRQRVDKYNFPFCTKISTEAESIPWGPNLEQLEATIRKRRSTRAYTGESLEFALLKSLLDFAYQPQRYVNQGLDANPDYCDLSLVETFIVVLSVDGLEEGCYYYAPAAQELRQIRFKNFRHELHFLCLGQDLGRDAAVVLFHTADLRAAVDTYGDRVYRYLHMDAGHLGQRLNLAASRLGIGVSGIGGFFDDQVNEVLGIPTDEAVLYITTFGQPYRPAPGR